MSIFLQITENYGNQEKAARALGVAPSTFSDWVTGKKIPNKTNMRLLINAGFSVDEIAKACLTPRAVEQVPLENNHGTRHRT